MEKSRSDCCNKIKASEQHDSYQPHTASGLYIFCMMAKGPLREFLPPNSQTFDRRPKEVFYNLSNQKTTTIEKLAKLEVY